MFAQYFQLAYSAIVQVLNSLARRAVFKLDVTTLLRGAKFPKMVNKIKN